MTTASPVLLARSTAEDILVPSLQVNVVNESAFLVKFAFNPTMREAIESGEFSTIINAKAPVDNSAAILNAAK